MVKKDKKSSSSSSTTTVEKDSLPTNLPEKTLNSNDYPELLKNFNELNSRTGHYTPIPAGNTPNKRKLDEYLKYGVINLDKPANPSSHEIVAWVKKILNVEKTGHSGTLDPKVTGCLIVCLNRATRLVKSQQGAGKEYVSILKCDGPVQGGYKAVEEALKTLTGAVFQMPPEQAAVKRQLRIRSIYDVQLFEFDNKTNMAVFWVKCQAGTYIRTLCDHLGLLLGTGGNMFELRRVKSGALSEKDHLYTMHDLLDAQYMYKEKGDETYLRKIIKPLEMLLVNYKRIIVKDSAVNSICYGAQLMIAGVLRFDGSIETGEEVVLVTTKGEAIGIANAVMTAVQIQNMTYGVVCKTKRVIMDRDTYPKRWGLGPVSKLKKELIQGGKLDKYGLPNENTPEIWLNNYSDVSANKWYYVQKPKIEEALGKKSERQEILDQIKPKNEKKKDFKKREDFNNNNTKEESKKENPKKKDLRKPAQDDEEEKKRKRKEEEKESSSSGSEDDDSSDSEAETKKKKNKQ
ncbi:hypothetical protein ABK040_001341 [Willaertia magna]